MSDQVRVTHSCHRLHRRGGGLANSTDSTEKGVQGVTILKPLVGRPMDPNLMTNLESFFNMDYSKVNYLCLLLLRDIRLVSIFTL